MKVKSHSCYSVITFSFLQKYPQCCFVNYKKPQHFLLKYISELVLSCFCSNKVVESILSLVSEFCPFLYSSACFYSSAIWTLLVFGYLWPEGFVKPLYSSVADNICSQFLWTVMRLMCPACLSEAGRCYLLQPVLQPSVVHQTGLPLQTSLPTKSFVKMQLKGFCLG